MTPIDDALITALARSAALSPRRRQHHNLHASYADRCQRLLNFLWCDSYIRPHRHTIDPKEETLIALRGDMGCLIFDDTGRITRRTRISAGGGCPAIVVHVGEWHTIVALSEAALLLETKGGPFDPSASKELANWVPDEGSIKVASYLLDLQQDFA